MDYIIVQAGGKGSRMESLTQNKPKALVPVENLPMIFHLFRKYPDKKYIIIGDYKYDVLEKYLETFAEVNYYMVSGTGHVGTCAGLAQAFSLLPEQAPFLLIWCDLVLPKDYVLPVPDKDRIGISKDFVCRWKYENGKFQEEKSAEHGVAGYFLFRNKLCLADVPSDGEFVRWLQKKNYIFEEEPLYRTHEYGLYSEWKKLPEMLCRPFNSIQIEDGKVYKTAKDEQGHKLARLEANWYRKLQGQDFLNIPYIYEYEPLCMERINGKAVYEYPDLSAKQKSIVLRKIISCLKRLHEIGSVPADPDSFYQTYIGKTFERMKKVQKLVPFAQDRTIMVNGRVCRNVFFYRSELERLVKQYFPSKFCFLHGDCTFSNIMLDSEYSPVLIDPRGYFGTTELFGDAAYDWAKLYYSLYSNYDQFNRKRFKLEIGEKRVCIQITSNRWEDQEELFFSLLEGEVTKRQMKLYLAVIWLSLTTYVWEDYDSICGAFYNGLYYFEEACQ